MGRAGALGGQGGRGGATTELGHGLGRIKGKLDNLDPTRLNCDRPISPRVSERASACSPARRPWTTVGRPPMRHAGPGVTQVRGSCTSGGHARPRGMHVRGACTSGVMHVRGACTSGVMHVGGHARPTVQGSCMTDGPGVMHDGPRVMHDRRSRGHARPAVQGSCMTVQGSCMTVQGSCMMLARFCTSHRDAPDVGLRAFH